jgi:hypothetical protein
MPHKQLMEVGNFAGLQQRYHALRGAGSGKSWKGYDKGTAGANDTLHGH